MTKAHRNTMHTTHTGQTLDHLGPYDLDSIYCADCITAMQALPDKSVDLAIADPPYNLSKGGEWKWDRSVPLPGFGGKWEKVMANWDDMPLFDYLAFTTLWIEQLKRIVKPTGSIWIHGTYHNIGIINFVLQLLSVEIINEIVWYKRNSFPNLAGRRFTASHETILWAHTGVKRSYYFDYELSKSISCPEDNLRETGKQMRTVWDIPNNKSREELSFGKHPTQKPLRLLNRMIRLSAKSGGICLIPFVGSGSECVAARQCGLHFIGFDTDNEYITAAKRRIQGTGDLFTTISQLPTEKPVEDKTNVPKQPVHDDISIPSLIKWTGGKRSQAHEIAKLIPAHDRYFEPFLGGGALLYLISSDTKISIAGDIYKPLIELWTLVRDNPQMVIDDYRVQWESLQSDLPKYFYDVRSKFNDNPNPLDLSFLMRTCVNGIVRFSSAGEFNNSFHLSRKGMQPERFESIVRLWSERIKHVSFLCQDYRKTLDLVKEGDFVYLDPPYAGSTQRYCEDIDAAQLMATLEMLNTKGVKWALSFDGTRAGVDLCYPVPSTLYKRSILLHSGNSAVRKVLSGAVERVEESLYLNY